MEEGYERGGDSHIISDLYQALDAQPKNVEIHERLLEMWQELGVEGNEIFVRSLLASGQGVDDFSYRHSSWYCQYDPRE